MRADKFFSEKFSSRTKASRALQKGLILRNGKALSPDDDVKAGDEFEILSESRQFVSLGGYKLARALDAFGVDISGLVFADLGASTGGFCDCLLQYGAKRVYCVDVGSSQLDDSLKNDSRVVVMDGVNARYLERDSFPQALDGVTADLSFISLKLVLPAISRILEKGRNAFLLLKPQFECGREGLKKGGICPVSRHRAILSEFYDFSVEHFLAPTAIVNAPLQEKKNVEYMIRFLSGGDAMEKERFLSAAERLK